MTIEEIKNAIKGLSDADRREIGKFILEMEKEKFQTEIPEDLNRLAAVIEEGAVKMKKAVLDEIARMRERK